jgi:hypothetical protein
MAAADACGIKYSPLENFPHDQGRRDVRADCRRRIGRAAQAKGSHPFCPALSGTSENDRNPLSKSRD